MEYYSNSIWISIFYIIELNEKLISILGSTGSIGLTTLKILDKKKSLFKPYLFIANKNYKLISKQIKKYQPNIVINNKQTFLNLEKVRNKK